MSISPAVAQLQEEVAPHREAIAEALAAIEAQINELRAKGFTADINWPYGRGEAARPTSAKLEVKVLL